MNAPPSLALLLVEADEERAERMERHLTGTFPTLVATRCGTIASARAYLAGTAFDAVCTAAELPDGPGHALVQLRDALGLFAPIFVWPDEPHVVPGPPEPLALAGASCFVLRDCDESAAAQIIGRVLEEGRAALPVLEVAHPNGGGDSEASGLLQALRTEAGAVAHAVNNPLTVIAGNAQLLGEMARMGALDPSLCRTVEDIEAAAQQLSEALGRLSVLRQRIAASLGVSDGL
ncbi:MAG: histidine kinase dimerization/phospho-acceptor domain-containing protein [Rubricoccaceae bacterium]|nr:histidine kinase dimerization/phospho-acceptor domain-containing protein [Rubricoccaceae bacterium]